MSSLAHGGLTPGTYQILDLGSRPIGTTTVVKSTVPYDTPRGYAVKFDIKTEFDEKYGNFTRTEEVFIIESGLGYFKRETLEEGRREYIEGRRVGDRIRIRHEVDGQRFSISVPTKDFEISEYDMEMPQSPFWGMKLTEGKHTRIFMIDDRTTYKAVRNVNESRELTFNGETFNMLVINTTIGGKIYHSWFHPKTHVLIRERRENIIYQRIED